ncbi:MFS transporter [Paenibacillus senegalimassiliensis]|uniref:MFS transporter n=1 Tax=Paenibacillus senegalimassiliensis TaxID=1737426 RepID=UPI00073F0A40|nr:MFS transporter [Paenibacillus senegalimassiliensis]
MNTTVNTPRNNGPVLLRVLVFTLIISVMNGTMFNVVLPAISKELNLSASQGSWIVTSYLIVYAIGTVTFGKLTDKYKLKDLLTFGLLLLAAGSVLGMMATQFWMIIMARIVQATGASVIPALSMIIPVRYFLPKERGRALGTTAIGTSLGAALGPIIAGFVTSALSWQFLFAIPLLALVTLPFYRKYLDDQAGLDQKIDYMGGVLLAGSVAFLLLALTNANVYFLLSGAVALILFIFRIRHAANPFVNPDIFRNKLYSLGIFITFIMVAIGFSVPFTMPQLLAALNDLSPAWIGLVMLPSALITAFFGRVGGRLADRKGNAFLLYIAAALLMVGFLCLSMVSGMSPVYIGFFLIFGILGQSFMLISLSNTISQTLSKEQVGIGMGLLSMLNFIAGAVSTAVIGKVLDHNQGAPSVYSNIFLVLAVLVAAMTLLYYFQFRRSMQKRAPGHSFHKEEKEV